MDMIGSGQKHEVRLAADVDVWHYHGHQFGGSNRPQ
jgi:hypothetical protein